MVKKLINSKNNWKSGRRDISELLGIASCILENILFSILYTYVLNILVEYWWNTYESV